MAREEFYQLLLCRIRKDYNKIFSIVIILKLMELSDSTNRRSSFDIIHSKGGFFGAWNLDIVCYLLFGAWNFLYSKAPLFLDILFDFLNVFVGHNTGWLHKLKPFPLGNPMAKIKLMPIGNGLEIERAISPADRRWTLQRPPPLSGQRAARAQRLPAVSQPGHRLRFDRNRHAPGSGPQHRS